MKLFETFTLGTIELQNRVVMAPMTRSRADAGAVPSALQAEYYGQRSSAGLIITEGTAPSASGLGYPRIPGLFTPHQIEGWRSVTAAAHAGGAGIFAQLMHVGRVAHRANLPQGAEVMAPSAVELPGEMYTDAHGPQPHTPARAMTAADIQRTVAEFAQAARNAIEAGFDGIEIHGANGYLVEQFIHPHTNRRDDGYGGPIENRARFALEVAQACSDAIGADKVGIRLSPYGVFNDMPHYADIETDFRYLVDNLSRLGLIYLHVVDHAAMGAPPMPDGFRQSLRQRFNGAFILSGGYGRDRAEHDLVASKGDLVAFGRPFIANPDLVTRMRQGLDLAEPDFDTFYTPGAQGYTDYPPAT